MGQRLEPTEFTKSLADYRKRILVSLAKALFIPPFLCVLVFLAFNLPFNALFFSTTFISIPLVTFLKAWLGIWQHNRAAAQLGARTIPRVKGKWPGNLDIAKRIVSSFDKGYVFQAFADLFAEYNSTTINTRLFWDDQIITMDEGVIQFISSTGFNHFEKGYAWHERIDKLLGTGLFNAEGELWKKGRATARPFFSKNRISDFEIFERVSSTTLDLIASRAIASKPVDVQDLLHRFTLDSASEFLFGVNLNTLSYPLTEPGKVKLGPKGSVPIEGTNEFDVFTEAFERVAVLITRRGAKGNTWPLSEMLEDKTEEPIATIMRWMDPLVKRALEAKTKQKETGIEAQVTETVFLDFLASQTDDVEHIRYELITYLIASRDTTASLLTFSMYFLAIHPDKCDRLRKEILSELGTDSPPTYDDLKVMKYLHAVLNEALRLFPSAPLIGRMSQDIPLVIPASDQQMLYLPPRSQVRMISLLLHRRKDLWGPDADEFLPERWLDAKVTAKINKNPWMYRPFSGGPRICIGQEFALNEAGYFLVRLLQRFQGFKLAPQYQPEGSLPNPEWKGKPGRQSIEQIAPAINFTMHSKGGVWMFCEVGSK